MYVKVIQINQYSYTIKEFQVVLKKLIIVLNITYLFTYSLTVPRIVMFHKQFN